MNELIKKQKLLKPVKIEDAEPVALKIDKIDRGGKMKIKFN